MIRMAVREAPSKFCYIYIFILSVTLLLLLCVYIYNLVLYIIIIFLYIQWFYITCIDVWLCAGNAASANTHIDSREIIPNTELELADRIA